MSKDTKDTLDKSDKNVYDVAELRAFHKGDRKYLIAWDGYHDSEASWEPDHNIIGSELVGNFEKVQEWAWEFESKGQGAPQQPTQGGEGGGGGLSPSSSASTSSSSPGAGIDTATSHASSSISSSSSSRWRRFDPVAAQHVEAAFQLWCDNDGKNDIPASTVFQTHKTRPDGTVSTYSYRLDFTPILKQTNVRTAKERFVRRVPSK